MSTSTKALHVLSSSSSPPPSPQLTQPSPSPQQEQQVQQPQPLPSQPSSSSQQQQQQQQQKQKQPVATSPQPQQEQRAGEVVIPGIINDDDESFPAPSPFLPTQNGIDQAQEITRKVAEEMHGITHIPAISSPSLGSPLAAATPAAVEHTALTPEDKLSHFCAMAREHREQQQQQQQQHHHHHHHHHQEVQHQAEQKGLIFEGEHFYFFDLLNADILTQTGLFGADVTTKMSDATSLIFSHNDMINFQEYKKFRLFSVECIVDSVSIGKPLPGSPHYIKQQQQQEQNGSDDSEYLNNNDDYDDDDNNNNDDNSLSQKCQHFPAYRGPLLSRCFEGIRVSVDRATLGEHGAELREMVEMLGGVFDGDAMRYGTSFFVCESNTSQWYQVAAQRDLHIVKPLWVADCFRALRFINPFSDHQRYVLGPLDSCVICTTKFSEQTTKEINTIVTSMGGRLVTEPSDSCTHYITTDGTDHLIRKFQRMRVPVVQLGWLYDSANAKSCLPTAQYVISEARGSVQQQQQPQPPRHVRYYPGRGGKGMYVLDNTFTGYYQSQLQQYLHPQRSFTQGTIRPLPLPSQPSQQQQQQHHQQEKQAQTQNIEGTTAAATTTAAAANIEMPKPAAAAAAVGSETEHSLAAHNEVLGQPVIPQPTFDLDTARKIEEEEEENNNGSRCEFRNCGCGGNDDDNDEIDEDENDEDEGIDEEDDLDDEDEDDDDDDEDDCDCACDCDCDCDCNCDDEDNDEDENECDEAEEDDNDNERSCENCNEEGEEEENDEGEEEEEEDINNDNNDDNEEEKEEEEEENEEEEEEEEEVCERDTRGSVPLPQEDQQHHKRQRSSDTRNFFKRMGYAEGGSPLKKIKLESEDGTRRELNSLRQSCSDITAAARAKSLAETSIRPVMGETSTPKAASPTTTTTTTSSSSAVATTTTSTKTAATPIMESISRSTCSGGSNNNGNSNNSISDSVIVSGSGSGSGELADLNNFEARIRSSVGSQHKQEK